MGPIQRMTTSLLLALTVWIAPAAAQAPQDRSRDNPAVQEEMRKGETFAQRRQYEPALQSYKKAYALSDKTSFEAWMGMVVAFRGLGAHKNVVDACEEGLKIAADGRQIASVHNMRGAALVALSDTPGDKGLGAAQRASHS